jgi:hypothetical protein
MRALSWLLSAEIMNHAPEFPPCVFCARMVFPGQPPFEGFGMFALQFALTTGEFV